MGYPRLSALALLVFRSAIRLNVKNKRWKNWPLKYIVRIVAVELEENHFQSRSRQHKETSSAAKRAGSAAWGELGQGTAGSGLAEPGQVQHLTSLGVALRRSALRSLSAKSNSSCRFAQKDADGKRTTLHSQRRRCNAAVGRRVTAPKGKKCPKAKRADGVGISREVLDYVAS